MKLASVEAIFGALDDAGARYLVTRGVAVNAHGYQRVTRGLDLVVDLARDNVQRTLRALARPGYRPVPPASAEAFADPGKRRRWNKETNLEVFSLTSDEHPETTVALLAREPFTFDEEHSRAMIDKVAPDLNVRFVRLRTLIA